MRERVQALHGEFKLVAAPHEGTAIYIKVPVKALTTKESTLI